MEPLRSNVKQDGPEGPSEGRNIDVSINAVRFPAGRDYPVRP